MLLDKNFNEIDAATLDALVESSAMESLHLDFKRDLYERDDKSKREFLKDISAFANTQGGHLIIGIDEHEGAASRVTPITGVDVDEEQMRLENMARTGLEPELAGLQVKRVAYDAGHVFVLQIPRSYNPPSRVTQSGTNRYWARNSVSCYELGLEELRSLFGQRRSMEERAGSFVRQRALEISAGNGSVPIATANVVLAFHVVPLLDFGLGKRHSVERLLGSFQYTYVLSSGPDKPRVNLEGLIASEDSRRFNAYTQIFRDGSVEHVCSGFVYEHDHEKTRHFPGWWLTKQFHDALQALERPYLALEVSSPILVSLSCFDIAGVFFDRDPHSYAAEEKAIQRSSITLPTTVVTKPLNSDTILSALREQMNYLWNAFGKNKCTRFDEDGKLKI